MATIGPAQKVLARLRQLVDHSATRTRTSPPPLGDAVTLVVDPLRCQGIGMCAHLAPGVVALDPWGYPLVPRKPLVGRDRAAAQSAAHGCPHRALHVGATDLSRL